MILDTFPYASSTMPPVSELLNNETSMLTSMSFASIKIPECMPRDGVAEIEKKTLIRWKEKFEAVMRFANIKCEQMKLSAFNMGAGAKIMDLL